MAHVILDLTPAAQGVQGFGIGFRVSVFGASCHSGSHSCKTAQRLPNLKFRNQPSKWVYLV